METFSEFREKNPDSKQEIIQRPLFSGIENGSELSRYSSSGIHSFLNNPLIKVAIGFVVLASICGYFYGKTSVNKPAQQFEITDTELTSSTTLKESVKTIKVYVAGAVVTPGVIEVTENARVADAIANAGGPNQNADLLYCDLAAYITDGETIIVPENGSTSVSSCKKSSGVSTDTSGSSAITQKTAKISLNKSSQVELETLPGVGPSLANAIISYRDNSGGFKSVEDLRKVKGIGEKRFADLKDLVST